jgi:hypothetical protein
VFAALAVSRWIEDRAGWSIRRFVRTARRYRTIEIQPATTPSFAADPLPDDLCSAVAEISQGAHQVEPSRGHIQLMLRSHRTSQRCILHAGRLIVRSAGVRHRPPRKAAHNQWQISTAARYAEDPCT